ELGQRLGPQFHAVRHDEALHLDAVGQDRLEGFHAVGFRRVVLRYQAADGDARERIHLLQHRVEDLAADVLEIAVDALRRSRPQIAAQPAALVVDAGVEAQLVHDVVALRLAAGDADCARAFQFRDLTDHAADRARGGGYHHGFARLRLADVEQPDPGGNA